MISLVPTRHPNVSSGRMLQIATDLAQEGFYTDGQAVHDLTLDRDRLAAENDTTRDFIALLQRALGLSDELMPAGPDLSALSAAVLRDVDLANNYRAKSSVVVESCGPPHPIDDEGDANPPRTDPSPQGFPSGRSGLAQKADGPATPERTPC